MKRKKQNLGSSVLAATLLVSSGIYLENKFDVSEMISESFHDATKQTQQTLSDQFYRLPVQKQMDVVIGTYQRFSPEQRHELMDSLYAQR